VIFRCTANASRAGALLDAGGLLGPFPDLGVRSHNKTEE
jgi:hypothetical protein